jgi:O-antigen ligase
MLDLTAPNGSERKSQGSRLLTRSLKLPFNPWWVLWVPALSCPWLLPTHLIPWSGFHADLSMTLALLPAAFWISVRTPQEVPAYCSAIVAFFLACIPLFQWASGMLTFSGDAWTATAYLFGFAVALLIGARFQQVAPSVIANALFAAFGLAALLSVGIVLYQWLRMRDLGLLILNTPLTYRPFGNLGQPNHLATLFVWGLLGLWWAYLSGRARGWIVFVAATFVMFGIAATQSRTAWIEITLLGLVAAVFRRQLVSHKYAKILLILAVIFITFVLRWEAINQTLMFQAPRGLADEMSPGLRPAAWRLFIDAITKHPWVGWGWNQVAVAQSAVALEHPSLRYTFHSTHNLVLDLLLQNGLPLGLTLVLALTSWMYVKARRVDTSESCLLLTAVAVLLVHALLEFPQNYAYFLFPVGLMMGALDTMYPWGAVILLKRWIVLGLVCIGTILTGWIAVEYNIAERNLERLRFERARVGPSRGSQAPELLMLTQLREFLRVLRYKPEAGMTSEQLENIRKVTGQFPSDGNQLVLAVAAGLNGKPEVARDALARMCHMVPPSRCRDALSTWRQLSASSPVLSAIDLPKVP